MDVTINIPFIVRALENEPEDETMLRAVDGLRLFVRYHARAGRVDTGGDLGAISSWGLEELVTAGRLVIIAYVLESIGAGVITEAAEAARQQAAAAVAAQSGLLQ